MVVVCETRMKPDSEGRDSGKRSHWSGSREITEGPGSSKDFDLYRGGQEKPLLSVK